MNNINTITSAKITLINGGMFAESDCNPSVIDIRYKGGIYAISKLPKGFLVSEGNNRILIVRISNNQMPEHIFNYDGFFKIISAKFYTSQGRMKYASISVNRHNYGEISDNWSQLNSNWADYRSGDFADKGDREIFESQNSLEFNYSTGNKSQIITNNLSAKDFGKIYLPDGGLYEGDMHYDSAYGFYTGAKKTKDSVLLKRRLKKIIKKRRRISARKLGGNDG